MPHPSFPLRTLVQIIAILFVGTLILMYVVFQARFMILGPQITLEPTPVGRDNQRVVTLTGTTHNITRLWLNDRPIFTDRDGNFTEALVLENGYTIATLRAEDRYGRHTKLHREFVYIPGTLLH